MEAIIFIITMFAAVGAERDMHDAKAICEPEGKQVVIVDGERVCR